MRPALSILTGLLWASSLSAAAPAVEKEIAFTGVLVSSGTTMICLTEADVSHWLELGQPFGDYRVTSYNAGTETVDLTNGDVSTPLRLKDSSEVQAHSAPSPTSASLAARLARWERITGLDGLELIRELTAGSINPLPDDKSIDALNYLNMQSERLEAEAATRNLERDKRVSESNVSEEHRMAFTSAQRGLASASAASQLLRTRLIEAAVVTKKSLRDSLSLP
jgi:hypothetical protein